ncbi:hypothetical protein N7468_004681 [Penicillium chermesinum]|uniref:Deacetylase complex subunit Sds3 n=1 Tax=Penicillium chermesinum TaxID=63820 RepID=A0A9W9P927_9EURO|nr:uncharacterized protein N7468_004681 [Penicillium chermesinum]KAJ5240062.1 hypothetical protein N7468_004681 [Penicillium chermesinum]KAJ6166938.1 hypothetical protein N7470_002385 [Penicillium chermesinum]
MATPGPPSPGTGATHQAGSHARGRSNSPLGGFGLSKRDKRRSALQERLQDLTTVFSQNRDAQFRQQLHGLQCDMTLINNANPYLPGPMPDSWEEISGLIEDTVGGGNFAREMASLSGSWYAKFVQEVNNIKEAKDSDLAAAMVRHRDSLGRYRRDRDFRARFAHEEFSHLANTLRERLMQSISSKRSRLTREKDHLDIADTNALLLHPNQFSITNPASPGGVHSNRKTRHTRHRVDLDDLGNGIASETNKRKRKAPEEDTGSPARDTGGTTPAERSKVVFAQQSAPSYSLHSLFTDKELSTHANHAHVATVHFFSTSKRSEVPGTTTNGNNTEAEDTPEATEDNSTPMAPDMARTASHNFHSTRSTRGTAANALSTLAELADKPATRPPLPYHILANYTARPNGNAPQLASLLNDEVDDDVARIERLRAKQPGWIDSSLLELVVGERDDVESRPTSMHPDFPSASGLQLIPAQGNLGAEMFPSMAMERERSSKRTRQH